MSKEEESWEEKSPEEIESPDWKGEEGQERVSLALSLSLSLLGCLLRSPLHPLPSWDTRTPLSPSPTFHSLYPSSSSDPSVWPALPSSLVLMYCVGQDVREEREREGKIDSERERGWEGKRRERPFHFRFFSNPKKDCLLPPFLSFALSPSFLSQWPRLRITGQCLKKLRCCWDFLLSCLTHR